MPDQPPLDQPADPESGAASALGRGGVRKRRRRNVWVISAVFAVPVVASIGGLAAARWQASAPVVKVRAPSGYKAVQDPYFAYAIPAAWSVYAVFTDGAGDLAYHGQGGWSAAHEVGQAARPLQSEAPPSVLGAFGQPRPAPYRLEPQGTLSVPGAAVAYRYQLVRPDQAPLSVVMAWNQAAGAEIWLVVDAPPAVTRTVVASLRA